MQKVKKMKQELKGSDFLALKRVCYGKESTKLEDREYRLFQGGPVGTVQEWLKFAKMKGFSGLRTFESDGSVRFHFIE